MRRMGRMGFVMVLMFSFKSLANENCGQVGEDECLDERHQDLNEINEYREQDRNR